MDYLEPITKVVQISQLVFWTVGAIVAVLGYRQAKRTIFQPIRTEIFKAQLDAMSKIMRRFLGKKELQLRAEFHFDTLFRANLYRVADAYAENFFGVVVEQAQRPYNMGTARFA